MSQSPSTRRFQAEFHDLPERIATLKLPQNLPLWPDENTSQLPDMAPLNDIGFIKTFYNGYKVLKYLLWTHRDTITSLKKPAQTPEEKQKHLAQAVQFVTRAFEDCGIKINYHGKTAKELGHQKILYASNHISWLDGFIHFIRTQAPVVAMAGTEKTPIVGKAFANVALMTVKRQEDMHHATAEDKKMANRIAVYDKSKALIHDSNGNGLVLFPEGKMSPGHDIANKPKRTIFRTLFKQDENAALTSPDDEAVIQPVAMIIRTVQGQTIKTGEISSLRDQFAYYGENAPSQALHLLKNIIPTATKGGVELDIYYLPPISVKQAYDDGFNTPAKLADAVMLQIQDIIQHPPKPAYNTPCP